jgi:flavodoxin
MKNLVVFYSKTGSNRFLAERIAGRLKCDIEEIRPRLNVFLLFIMRINAGIRALRHHPKDYDRVVMVGPVWVGKFVTPLKAFTGRYKKSIKQLVFVSCCGSGDEMRDKKFGHGRVFDVIKNSLGEKCVHCEAFPIGLALPPEKRSDSEAIMAARLSDENFTGELLARYEALMEQLEKGLPA